LYIQQIYESAGKLKEGGNQIFAIWAPVQEEVIIKVKAKELAKQETEIGREVREQSLGAKATVLGQAIAKQRQQRKPIERVGEYTRKLDTALPEKHTRLLYDSFKRTDASILAQLRTRMIRLNGYLHRIGASETDQCTCGQARETVEHFLFRCIHWEKYRRRFLQQTDTRGGCLSFFLGGKAPSDPPQWQPNILAVRTTVKYALATGRLALEAP
jgi:hypothetical protein